MIRIVASSHYFSVCDGDAALASLDERAAAVTRERYRRVDRFVQLALLGSGECAGGLTLEPDCGLYVSSGTGPIGSNLAVQVAIHVARHAPMPFDFVNALGSSAAHYVAKNLALTGEGLFLSRDRASFTTAVECAMADLTSGVATQALVGAVEQVTLPVERHRRLLHLDGLTLAAEGSHWILLGPEAEDGTLVPERELADERFARYESRDAALLTSYLERHAGERFGLAWSADGGCRLLAAN